MNAVLTHVQLPAELPPGRRMLKHPRLMQSHRLTIGVLLVNALVLAFADLDIASIALIAQLNFALGIFTRQQFFVNALCKLVMRVPKSWPLKLRWSLAKGYHLGGLHVGGAISGTLWFWALTVVAIGQVDTALQVTYCVQSLLLFAITMTSRPKFRAAHHDLFERMHRFGGWTLSGLFWLSALQLGSPSTIVVLTITTISSLSPWLLLRRIPVDVLRPSSHVALVSSNRYRPMAGSTRSIARHPLKQWHSFAVIPTPGAPGFRMAISRAGDWTSDFIDNPPSHIWVRGIATAGMANYGSVFNHVVYVVTGSGIGPVLAHILANRVPMQLVWVTRNPVKTYGQSLVDEILRAQPNAIIWDSDAHGKPDMVKLAYSAYESTDAEAVICVSNRKVTWQVVHGMEKLGIPALGPIWDS